MHAKLILPDGIVEAIGNDNFAVLERLSNYLRNHYDIRNSLMVEVEESRNSTIALFFENRPLRVLVTREFLSAYRDSDLASELDDRWFLPILLQECTSGDVVALDSESIERIRRA
jgi:hypothetical protein